MTTSELSLVDAAKVGRLAGLDALRDLLTVACERCESYRDLASLSGRLQSVLEEIDALRPPEKKGDSIDEIAARRSSRGSSAGAGSARAKDVAK